MYHLNSAAGGGTIDSVCHYAPGFRHSSGWRLIHGEGEFPVARLVRDELPHMKHVVLSI